MHYTDCVVIVSEATRFILYKIGLRTRTFLWIRIWQMVSKTFVKCQMCL